MNNQTNISRPAVVDFDSDLRISAIPLGVTIFLMGIVVVYLGSLPLELLQREVIVVLGCAEIAFAAALVWFEQYNWWVGRCIATLLIVISIDVLGIWLGILGALILGPIVVVFAVAVVDSRFALALTILQTAFILALPSTLGVSVSSDLTLISCLALWIGFSVMLLIYHPVRQVGQWVMDYYLQSRALADEMQQRRGEYEQLVKDLAQANLQMARLNVIAQGLRQSAEAARTAKEQFVANVSHELRTPLNMIIGFSEMILQTPEMYGARTPPPLLADLAVIHRNAEHLTDLIDDVLDLSQIEADKMALTKEFVQFPEVVQAAVQAVRPLYESKGLYLRINLPNHLPQVFCDPTRIREVLLNLLSNAGRFTEQGGVDVRVQCDDSEVIVSVSDTGKGIPSADMDKLFQPFQQLDGTVRRLYGGTGLGLNISKQFIELHGGTISVQSQPGVGTTFVFRLPIVPPAPLSEDSTRWLTPDWTFLQRTGPTTAPKPVVRPRLLVVEEGEVLKHLLTRYLEGTPTEIVCVPAVDQAVAVLEQTPALALLVNSSTIPQGMEMLKATLLPNGTPALVCVVPEPRDTQTGMGVSDILVKPISQEMMLSALDRLGLTQGTVLVVDDEPDGLQLFGRMLASSKHSYRVLQARDGTEALNILAEHRPDVIMLDLVMPNMDGFRLLTALKESRTLRDIPRIIISARDPTGQPIMCHALAVVQAGGISAHQLLACVHAMTQILSPALHAEPKLPANRDA